MDHYTEADMARTRPIREQVKEIMIDAGWMDLDDVALLIGARPGTVASKLRELVDADHAYLGLAYERRGMGKGRHEYRLFVRQPEQLTLLEGVQHG